MQVVGFPGLEPCGIVFHFVSLLSDHAAVLMPSRRLSSSACRMPRHLPFGWLAVAQASLVVVFVLVWPHVVQDMLADKRMHVTFRMTFRHRGRLGHGPTVTLMGFGVPFALAFDLGDGPVVGDLVPVVGETARGIDTAKPERVRGQPVDDRRG